MTMQLIEIPGLARIRERYYAAQTLRHDRLEVLLEIIRANADPFDALVEARGILHQISGTAGSLGFAELGASASKTEYLIDGHLHLGRGDPRNVTEAIDAFLEISLDFCHPTL